MHRERLIDRMATARVSTLERNESARVLLILLLLRLITFLLALQLLLQLSHSSSIVAAVGDAAILQTTAVKAWTVVIITLPDDLATAYDDSAMAVVQRRLRGLLEAKRQVVVGLHFDC